MTKRDLIWLNVGAWAAPVAAVTLHVLTDLIRRLRHASE